MISSTLSIRSLAEKGSSENAELTKIQDTKIGGEISFQISKQIIEHMTF